MTQALVGVLERSPSLKSKKVTFIRVKEQGHINKGLGEFLMQFVSIDNAQYFVDAGDQTKVTCWEDVKVQVNPHLRPAECSIAEFTKAAQEGPYEFIYLYDLDKELWLLYSYRHAGFAPLQWFKYSEIRHEEVP